MVGEKRLNKTDKKFKIMLLLCNVILIAATITAALLYSGYIRKNQEESKTDAFIRMIESMKQVSQNYLDRERGYVKDWAAYISEQEMTREEALDFLRSVNSDKERFIHIVDMDTYEAWSASYPAGEEEIETYLPYKELTSDWYQPFVETMQGMFNGTDDGYGVLGKYRLEETHAAAVSVGTRVTLQTAQGSKDYLLVRAIPVEVLKKSWVFPVEYSSAEVGIITRNGDYVIQSNSMKSQNFLEYIRGYNFQDDYNAMQSLEQQLQETDNGILTYKNFRGTDCIWYYSSFAEGSALDILGVVNADEMKATIDAWYIVTIVCSFLLVLIVIDGAYLLSMNRRLREAATISEQASRAKTQFLSAMSHDIRTPLNAVMGMMSIAQKKADDPVAVAECMDKGMHSGKQLMTLINDVLDISRIESGRFTLKPERVDLTEVVHDLTEMLETSIRQKNITLDCDFDRLPHKCVSADRTRLDQIYVNLLTNAVKYTEPGGKIRLQLYEEEIPENAIDTRLVFYIKDNGIGMTEEFQKEMYNTFSRETRTQVNSTQGSGLGLSIVKQMVDLMNGKIECKSTSGEGTSFTVILDLPFVEEEQENKRTGEQNQDISGIHLLIAEDNELNWEIAQELLAEHGVICDHAEDGKECVEMLTKAPLGTYTAILMDVHMPEMNGLEATRVIRALPEAGLREIPIVAMTADAFAEDVQACMDSGMNGHIAKPIEMNKLISYLNRIKSGQL